VSNESWWVFLAGVFVSGVVYAATLFVLIVTDNRKKRVVKTVKGDEALRLWVNHKKAEAWEEGYNAQWEPCCSPEEDCSEVKNPYRQGEEQ